MSRIRKAYENSFRQLLAEFGARRVEQGVQLLLNKSVGDRAGAGVPRAWAARQIQLRQRLRRWKSNRLYSAPSPPPSAPARFVCDAGLGGLARWMRAFGYDSYWIPGIRDPDLLDEAARRHAAILTTDSLLMERRRIARGEIPALWIPPTFTIQEQLRVVCAEIPLTRREPRCMRCGGALLAVQKEAVRERIPPKTLRWIDEYFECERCQKLFWKGAHWRRIEADLAAVAPAI